MPGRETCVTVRVLRPTPRLWRLLKNPKTDGGGPNKPSRSLRWRIRPAAPTPWHTWVCRASRQRSTGGMRSLRELIPPLRDLFQQPLWPELRPCWHHLAVPVGVGYAGHPIVPGGGGPARPSVSRALFPGVRLEQQDGLRRALDLGK